MTQTKQVTGSSLSRSKIFSKINYYYLQVALSERRKHLKSVSEILFYDIGATNTHTLNKSTQGQVMLTTGL